MVEKIVFFWLIVYASVFLLKYLPPNPLSAVAFTWFGPFPEVGELLSGFKWRRVAYAFTWFIQFVTAYAVLFLVDAYVVGVEESTYFLVFLFALFFGFGISLFATVGFFLSWAKTKIIGPDGEFVVEEYDENGGT